MDALNQQEIHKKKLVALTQQTTLFQNETTALKTDKDKLQSLYDKQDEILCEFPLYVNYQLGNAFFYIRIAYHGTKHCGLMPMSFYNERLTFKNSFDSQLT